ncbi:hypothetical protein MXB_1083 [Myxobolus squamalis]|nr:hypothetical protein MXB_1083 [Myxobolus squamalis]
MLMKMEKFKYFGLFEWIRSIESLLRNCQIDEVFSEYDKSIGELQKYQTIERNISMTVQFLVKCLPALTIDKIFDQHIDPSNYIDLIDSCCKLEKMHDPITFLNKTLENFTVVGFRYWSKTDPIFLNIDFKPVYWYAYILNELTYTSLCNFILLHLANSIKNPEQFSKIRDIKIVLSQFDRIMQSFSLESNILSRSVNVFRSLDAENHFIKHYFSTAQEQFSTLSIFSVPHSDAQFPITLEIPKFLNDLIFKYMKVCGIEKEKPSDPQIETDIADQNNFEALVGFSDIAIRRINIFLDQNKTLDGVNGRLQPCQEMIAKVDDCLTDFAKETISDSFNIFNPEFNPINENSDISPVLINMMDYICNICEKLAKLPSQLFDNFVVMCSSKISDIFVSFISLNNVFNSCNKNFISSMMNHLNYLKLRLMENCDQNIHSKIENDFNELKMTLHLIMIDDWSNYFDNYGLSFSPYFRVNPDTLLKITKKFHFPNKNRLLTSENASMKQTFSKFFTKEKKEKSNLNEIIASLQKLIYKND